MRHIQTYQVFPKIPKPLRFLEVLSRNLWWSWKRDVIELYRRVDPRLWEQSGQNPIAFATLIPQERFEQLATDDSFLAHLDRVKTAYKSRVLSPSHRIASPYGEAGTIAYFSMEFGIHESLPLFAGGLGVLAGDHLKSASTLNLPLVAVGLLYREGYFRQFLNQEGWQQESYPRTELYHLPLTREKDKKGKDLVIKVTGPNGDIHAQVWRIKVGRIPLILLDTNLQRNPPEIRDITARLYGGDPPVRLAQEVLLGIGGLRALAALNFQPTVCHMNEGHCSFVGVERIAQIMEHHKVSLEIALQVIPRTTIFTTHTPVAAGHDSFPADIVKPYLTPYEEIFDLPVEDIIAWGQPEGVGPEGNFSMFVLGLRNAQHINGVSKLHGDVARKMWDHVWPNRTGSDVPITHVTNGIHIGSFVSPEVAHIFERYLGPEWYEGSIRSENIIRIGAIYDEELWRAHELSRSRLIRSVRKLMIRQYSRRNAPSSTMREMETVLDQDALTIGFARRFATYKRANLILRDPDRLAAILDSKEKPVQFIFAGKAHPRDNEGKALIQNLIQFAQRSGMRHRMVFVEDYDMSIARLLVQGVDVWLNTPRRPMEACGTSGMKAAINGVLNLSVLDGWWCEGYTPERGWAIGSGEEFEDPEYQDSVESQALYNLLETDVIPCFYDRSDGNMPLNWLKRMKASMQMAMADFCSHRMVESYAKRFYVNAHNRFGELLTNGAAEAKRLSQIHERLRSHWSTISLDPPQRDSDGPFRVSDHFGVTASVHLGELKPEDVRVELAYGHVVSLDRLANRKVATMTVAEDWGKGNYLYRCELTCDDPGRFGFTVRVTPEADDWIRYTPGLITWA
jgi:glycogen phosphorylase